MESEPRGLFQVDEEPDREASPDPPVDPLLQSDEEDHPEEKVRLERNLAFLGTLGANAPFIGLFGTVLGIIKAFKDLAESGLKPGGETSTEVMSGISEALVATAVGLLVAIPAVVAYNIFQRRVKRTMGEAESLANTARSLVVGRALDTVEKD